MTIDQSDFTDVMNGVAEALNHDKYHRLLSWDHAWEHWQSFSTHAGSNEEFAALHLAFYLASWGMYRGKGDLLYRDFKVFIPVVRLLKKESGAYDWSDCMFDADQNTALLVKRLRDLGGKLEACLKEMLIRPGKTAVNVSDTLLSKILLNTLGCVPAFDSEVKGALRGILGKGYSTGDAFDTKRLTKTIELAQKNRDLVLLGQRTLTEKTGNVYPLTKVLDLYLWHYGFSSKPQKTDE